MVEPASGGTTESSEETPEPTAIKDAGPEVCVGGEVTPVDEQEDHGPSTELSVADTEEGDSVDTPLVQDSKSDLSDPVVAESADENHDESKSDEDGQATARSDEPETDTLAQDNASSTGDLSTESSENNVADDDGTISANPDDSAGTEVAVDPSETKLLEPTPEDVCTTLEQDAPQEGSATQVQPTIESEDSGSTLEGNNAPQEVNVEQSLPEDEHAADDGDKVQGVVVEELTVDTEPEAAQITTVDTTDLPSNDAPEDTEKPSASEAPKPMLEEAQDPVTDDVSEQDVEILPVKSNEEPSDGPGASEAGVIDALTISDSEATPQQPILPEQNDLANVNVDTQGTDHSGETLADKLSSTKGSDDSQSSEQPQESAPTDITEAPDQLSGTFFLVLFYSTLILHFSMSAVFGALPHARFNSSMHGPN